MSILIDRVRISNFRSLRRVEVVLSPVTVLVGMNNSGKSGFYSAKPISVRWTTRQCRSEGVESKYFDPLERESKNHSERRG